MANYTSAKKIETLCKANDVRLSRTKENKRTVYGLHGFLSDVQAVERQIIGYFIEQSDSGHFLYRQDLSWGE